MIGVILQRLGLALIGAGLFMSGDALATTGGGGWGTYAVVMLSVAILLIGGILTHAMHISRKARKNKHAAS